MKKATKKTTVTDDQKIDFIWHSNRIDHNTIDPQTLERSVVAQTVLHKYGPTEIKDHVAALNTTLAYGNTKSIHIERVVKAIHSTLMKNIKPECAGKYRACRVWVGWDEGIQHVQIPAYMKRLHKMFLKCKTEQDCWDLHHEFECVHPFVDGNGRCGRLLSVWIHARLGLKFPIVQYEDRFDYYKKIREYRHAKFQQIPRSITEPSQND